MAPLGMGMGMGISNLFYFGSNPYNIKKSNINTCHLHSTAKTCCYKSLKLILIKLKTKLILLFYILNDNLFI